MRAYCYVDIPGVPVNPQAGPQSGDGLLGDPPPKPYGDVDDRHAELTGFVDSGTGTVAVSGCFENRDLAAPLGHVYVQWSWDTATGTGTADTWVFQDLNDCLNGPPGAPDASGQLQLMDTSYEEDVNSDGDGCTDRQELGNSTASGGLRDPFNPWDYFNPSKNATNRSKDTTAVINHYGIDYPNPAYDVNTDRGGPIPGANGWNLLPPNGTVRAADLTAAVNSYGHDCGPP